MGKLKTFFYSFFKTFTSPKYYLDILKAPLSFSLKFFLFYFLLYGLLGTAIITVRDLKPVSKFIKILPQKLQQVYPPELEIKIKNGIASTNVQEPYFIPIDIFEKTFKDEGVLGDGSEKIWNLLVIDTTANIEDFKKYQTMALLTKKFIVYQDQDGKISMYPLEKITNLTINQSLVNKLLSQITPFLKYIIPILIVGIFLSLFSFESGYYLFYLLIPSFLLWILGKIIKTGLRFSKVYQFNLHLAVIYATIFGILSLFNLNLEFGLLKLAIFLILGLVVSITVKNSRNEEVPPVQPFSPA